MRIDHCTPVIRNRVGNWIRGQPTLCAALQKQVKLLSFRTWRLAASRFLCLLALSWFRGWVSEFSPQVSHFWQRISLDRPEKYLPIGFPAQVKCLEGFLHLARRPKWTVVASCTDGPYKINQPSMEVAGHCGTTYGGLQLVTPGRCTEDCSQRLVAVVTWLRFP